MNDWDRVNNTAGSDDNTMGDDAMDGAMDDETPIEELRERVLSRTLECARNMLVRINRSWQSCGKASCVRARRCRGFACEPGDDDDGDE